MNKEGIIHKKESNTIHLVDQNDTIHNDDRNIVK